MDVSSTSLSTVLTQPGEGDLDDPISFSNGKLSTMDQNYTTIEREGLAMVYALLKFRHYLLGSHFKMYTDHSMMRYLCWNVNLRLGEGGVESVSQNFGQFSIFHKLTEQKIFISFS